MPYDEYLAERISNSLKRRSIVFEEKKMMGGLCYMVDEKMCLGVVKDHMMVRLNPEEYEGFLAETGARPMDFTGRPMKGYLFIDPEGLDLDDDLEKWIQRCLDFNPLAKASKKRKSK